MPTPSPGEQEWLEHIPVAAYMTDEQGFITYFNDKAAMLWGRRPVLGTERWSGAYKLSTIWDVPLSLEESPMATALREGREMSGPELILERPDGTKRLILPHPKPLFDDRGMLKGALNIVADLTEVKYMELRQSEERYHKMVVEVEDYAILLLDDHGVIRNWNTGAEKIKGYKEAEIVGKHFRIFYTPADQEAKLPERLIDEAAKKGKAIHEGWRQRKDGTLFWGSVVITALHDRLGSVIGFSKVTRDLTVRRVAEEKLRRYSQHLEFQNRELQQFAYAAAHDMKEPLRKLRYYNVSLMETMQGRLSQREELYLQRAAGAATRMQTLIDDLLAYSRVSTDGGALGEVSLQQMMEEAKETFQDLIEETKGEIRTKDLPMVRGIAFQLRQLFENLLGNSLKYRARERQPVIQIIGERGFYLPDGTTGTEGKAEEYFKITVVDNGIGFEQKKADRIFDIFQRLDNRDKFPGTGIGLAICKRVVQNHKGFILADSTPGNGARFMIFLPVGMRSYGPGTEG